MSSSTPILKFLIDENVRVELAKFLRAKKYNVKTVAPQSSDSLICSISKKESRILVTNDSDFSKTARDEISSVIWLRIPQRRADILLSSFKKLLAECKDYHGRLIMLSINTWKTFPLIRIKVI